MKSFSPFAPLPDQYLGLISAIAIFVLWLGTLVFALSTDLAAIPNWLILLTVITRTFLHTGLFIIAHDAAHGTVVTFNRDWNAGLGNLAISLYALLPYQQFCHKHYLHHATPAQAGDPDFHAPDRSHPLAWYGQFMGGYLTLGQISRFLIIFTLIFHGLRIYLHISGWSLILFWVLPLLLSSFQLFYFGTYLPHRLPQQGYQNRHRATSQNLGVFWSALTCYHFGYHWEHHEYPHLPWFKLPLARQWR
ncbi:MAG: fatty acid desaturase [Pseudanabaenaceae cyanobacterium bins.68]|nr:fatty acid desaturase [Pseudanabaenaceae cyanobacterium bins.68]